MRKLFFALSVGALAVAGVLAMAGCGSGGENAPSATASPTTAVPTPTHTPEPATPTPTPTPVTENPTPTPTTAPVAQDSADVMEKVVTFDPETKTISPNPIVVRSGVTYTFIFIAADEYYTVSSPGVLNDWGVYPPGSFDWAKEKYTYTFTITAKPGEYPIYSYPHSEEEPVGTVIVK